MSNFAAYMLLRRLSIILLGGLLIIFFRAKNFPQGKMYENFYEPAFAILLSCLLFVFIAVIVWLGMSMPLLSQLVGESAAVDENFYVRSTAPIAAVLVGLVIYSFLKFGKSISLGGKISHAGFILTLMAIVVSPTGVTTSQTLENDSKIEVEGHQIVYLGQQLDEENRRKFYVYEVDGKEITALTKLRGNGNDAAREPAILKTFSGDIYIAPHAPENLETRDLILIKNNPAMDGEILYTFIDAKIDYDAENKPIQATAKIEVTDGVAKEIVEPLITVTADGGTSKSVEFLQSKRRVRLTGVSGDLSKVRLEILPTIEEFSNLPVTATISTKPFIWLLWLSAAAICAGNLIAVKKF